MNTAFSLRRAVRMATIVSLASLIGATPRTAPAQEALIAPGAVWKYFDEGSNLGTAWRFPDFDDHDWEAGPAKLGYGDSDVVTVVSYGPLDFLKYMTTYFRHRFRVDDPRLYGNLALRLRRDDGAVVYLNGLEIARSNMVPAIPVDFLTPALTNVQGSDEDEFEMYSISPTHLVAGANTLAVEIHQSSPFSSDLGFDLELLADSAATVTRGPYLQLGAPDRITVRWRTDVPTLSRVWLGASPDVLTSVVDNAAFTTEHAVTIVGLEADTRYYYAVGKGNEVLAGGDESHYFVTSPPVGTPKPTRVWVLGDSGTANANAAAVRDAYRSLADDRHTDLWLMLGDNAYNEGTDAQYQAAVFDMYPETLRTSVLWPTRGNHEIDALAYFGIFDLPTAGEAGGAPSGDEAYYAFDHGNIHFICLSSFELTNAFVGGPMWNWLEVDLASTDQEWIVAYWHHPPYSKGSHDSDLEWKLIQMRTNFLPLLEAGGVDLVLSGHSHCYERSFLLNGHYGFSQFFDVTMLRDRGDGRPDGTGAYEKAVGPHQGTVYCVAGSSGKTAGGTFDHPAMYFSKRVLGSLVLDFDRNTLDARFLNADGDFEDWFTLRHLGAGFRRGDVDRDGRIHLPDATSLLRFAFLPDAPTPSCLETADVDNDGTIGLPDGIWLLNYLFVPGSPSPTPPFPACGSDPDGPDLGCGQYDACG